jgi:pyrimidine operon attenuation protein / uracil phosphoribosyltransferase
MRPVTLLDSHAFGLTVTRLCHQLIEDHDDLSNTALIGLQPRGVLLGRRLRKELQGILKRGITYGDLDITFHRDDFRHRPVTAMPSSTDLDFSIDGRHVVLVDDVLFTGRTIRAGLDALLSFGRPASVQLLVLIDRRFSRELPIQPDYVGRWVDSIADQRVTVEWASTDGKDRVLIHEPASSPTERVTRKAPSSDT